MRKSTHHIPKPEPENHGADYATVLRIYRARLEKETAKSARLKPREIIPREERKDGAAFQLRRGLADNYELPVTAREAWWRVDVQETPIPTHYPIENYNFLSDTKPGYASTFKSSGRKKPPYFYVSGAGQTLMPGIYKIKDSIKELDNTQITYHFKDEARNKKDLLNFGKKDKDINVAPNLYHAEKYEAISAPVVSGSRNAVFKSQVRRFPTLHFVPKDGPPPGGYNSKSTLSPNAVSACFKSRTARFSTSHTVAPGPGTYHPTTRPQSDSIMKMGEYGLFFKPQYIHLLQPI